MWVVPTTVACVAVSIMHALASGRALCTGALDGLKQCLHVWVWVWVRARAQRAGSCTARVGADPHAKIMFKMHWPRP